MPAVVSTEIAAAAKSRPWTMRSVMTRRRLGASCAGRPVRSARGVALLTPMAMRYSRNRSSRATLIIAPSPEYTDPVTRFSKRSMPRM